MMLAGGAGAALAQTPTPGQGCNATAGAAQGCATVASVTVKSVTTITDLTASVSWATPASLPATEYASSQVAILVSSNSSTGYTVGLQHVNS
jgi:septal ring-binding cell division protein DamX